MHYEAINIGSERGVTQSQNLITTSLLLVVVATVLPLLTIWQKITVLLM
jgi:hypothetical protein